MRATDTPYNDAVSFPHLHAVPAAALLPDDLRVFERGWLSSTGILCLGDEPALIDTGHARHAERTVTLVRDTLQDTPLRCIAHTHLHSNHCGGTQALQQAWPDTVTHVPAASWTAVRDWQEDALRYAWMGQRCPRFAADEPLQPGHVIRLGMRTWEIHAAPGHDARAVLFFDPASRTLVAGDALWRHGVGVIFPEISHTGEFAAFARTLDVIERLDPAVVIPGHGPAFAAADGSVDAALQQARERLRRFADDPDYHALYSAKVMIKFQLMDAGCMTRDAFDAWLAGTPILRAIHHDHGHGMPWQPWIDDVLSSLANKGALHIEREQVYDGPR